MNKEEFIREWYYNKEREKKIYLSDKGAIFADDYSVSISEDVSLWLGDYMVAIHISFDMIKRIE
jgi:hypothetical protein